MGVTELSVIKLLILTFSVNIMAKISSNVAECWWSVYVDHFNIQHNATFQLRYLLDSSYYNATGASPLVVYTGNEGDIYNFAENSGSVFELGKRLNAIIVFIEQRYYGKSIVSVGSMFEFLSSAQVLGDYVQVIEGLKEKYNAKTVVSVGGSYGGMLTAWLQRQHPDLITAAWASSAPVLGFANVINRNHLSTELYQIVANTYSIDGGCGPEIKLAFHSLVSAKSDELIHIFNICPSLDVKSITEDLVGLLQQHLANAAMLDYPYAVNFSGLVLPAHSPSIVCSKFKTALNTSHSRIVALRDALNWLYNQSGSMHCLKLRPFEAYYPGLIPGAWTYQRCTDFIMAISVGENNKMFLPCSQFKKNCWDASRFTNFCAQTFGISPRPPSIQSAFYSEKWPGEQPRLLLSNGMLDPWGYGGVDFPPSNLSLVDKQINNDSPIVLWIPDAAHHLDLRASHPEDPESVTTKREFELHTIVQWINNIM